MQDFHCSRTTGLVERPVNLWAEHRNLFAGSGVQAARFQSTKGQPVAVLICSIGYVIIGGQTSMRGRCPLLLYVYGDDELEASVHKMLLEHGGYEVLAASGYRAFAVLKDNPVDAVVVGLTRGGHHAAFVSRMKAIKPHIPVLLVVDGSAAIRLDKYGKADAALLREHAPGLLLSVLDDLLNVRFPFFTRWFGNWRYRVGA